MIETIETDDLNLRKLPTSFYERETLDVAKDLIGKYLVRNIEGTLLIGKISETEAYKENDKAAHFYEGKRTNRTEVAFGHGGHAYVYLIYGMYYCFNVVTEGLGVAGAVLIRGIEPLVGIEEMIKYRKKNNDIKIKDLSNGPGKLCVAFNIKRELNGEDLTGEKIFICEDTNLTNMHYDIKVSKRINIDYSEECKDYLWRFYL